MAQYKLIAVSRTHTFLDVNSNTVSYTLTYEKKAWYYFGKIKTVKNRVECPDMQIGSWVKSIEDKIKLGEWRKG